MPRLFTSSRCYIIRSPKFRVLLRLLSHLLLPKVVADLLFSNWQLFLLSTNQFKVLVLREFLNDFSQFLQHKHIGLISIESEETAQIRHIACALADLQLD